MIGLSVLKDASEVVHYRDANFPVYAGVGHLSSFSNMEMMCHWHEDVEYIRVLKGRMTYSVNGEKQILDEGEAILIHSRQLHYGFSADGSDCHYLCILFRPLLLTGSGSVKEGYIDPLNDGVWGGRLYPGRDAGIMDLFDRVFKVFKENGPCGELRMIGLLCEIWARWYVLAQPQALRIQNSPAVQIQKDMVDFIHRCYGSKVSLKDIAMAGGVCESMCCKIFKNLLNKSPVEFLNAYRLEISMNLLRGTDFSITEIAYSCGFGSSSYYSETFMKYKGCTPRQYRALQRKAG